MLAVGKTGNAKSGNALAEYELGQKYLYSSPNGFAIQSITISIARGKSSCWPVENQVRRNYRNDYVAR